MARPKGKLIALLAIFAAIGLVTASGAFTTVQADRTVSVNVAGDSAALLQLQTLDSEYASENSEGELEITFDQPGSASGVNPNATTVVVKVFNVTNQGSGDVNLTWTKSGSNTGSVILINSTNSNANTQTNASVDEPITLTPGESYSFGVLIEGTDKYGSKLTNSSTVNVVLELNATSTSG